METLKRDGFRCTAILVVGNGFLPKLNEFAIGDTELRYRDVCRCLGNDETDELEEHHTDYQGGKRVTLCRPHHQYIESQLRWYSAGRRRGRRG